MTTQHIYVITKVEGDEEDALFWSDGAYKRGFWAPVRGELIRSKTIRKKYGYFSDYKDSCVLLIPKEFC
jgi:hypothetical protein